MSDLCSLLISFSDNYADEFDLYGFAIISEEAWHRTMDRAMDYFISDPFYSYGFGTNEELVYETFEQYKRHLTLLRVLSPEEEKKMLQDFQMKQQDGIAIFGHFPLIEGTEPEDFEVFNG